MKSNSSQKYKDLNFSQRNGYESLPSPMRLEYLSEYLRCELRDTTQELIESFEQHYPTDPFDDRFSKNSELFWKGVLGEFLKKAKSEIPNSCSDVAKISNNIIDSGEFNKVLDFLEMILKHLENDSEQFAEALRTLFTKHQAAYWLDMSFMPYQFFPSTSEEQAEAIKHDIETINKNKHHGAATHLRQAVEHINARQYADSVLDSILAVESVARKIDPKSSQTLGPALGSLQTAGLLKHPAMIKGFKSLYGYTSDEGGIRHSLVDKYNANVGQEEAIFMFGACASFAAYLSAKHLKLT